MTDSARLLSLVAQLDSNERMKRLDAVYKLGSERDKRTVPYLIRMLRNNEESSMVRGQPLVVIRALHDRLGDMESPDDRGNWWPVGLEALAMLRSYKKSRLPIEQMFRGTILKVMRDPLSHSNQMALGGLLLG
jgi:hypothetical protein